MNSAMRQVYERLQSLDKAVQELSDCALDTQGQLQAIREQLALLRQLPDCLRAVAELLDGQ